MYFGAVRYAATPRPLNSRPSWMNRVIPPSDDQTRP